MQKGKGYFWLIVTNAFFDQPILKKIRRKCGDVGQLIYIKLLLTAVSNYGYINFNNLEDNLIEEIAYTIDHDVEDVQNVINCLYECKKIEMTEDSIYFEQIVEMIGYRSAQAQYMKKYRENKDSKLENDVEKPIIKSKTKKKKDEGKALYKMQLKDGYYLIAVEEMEHLKTLYLNVDVEQEIRKMVGWCEANATKRKTRSGIKRFINSWLSKAESEATKPTKIETKKEWELPF